MSRRENALESHALTVLPTLQIVAEVAKALIDGGTPRRAVGLVALEDALQAPSDATGAWGVHLPPASEMGAVELTAGGRLTASRGHAFDRLSEARGAGATSLSEALGAWTPAGTGARFGDAVSRGQVLIWTMTTSVEAASVVVSVLLAHSAERVCTFTRAAPVDDAGWSPDAHPSPDI